MKNIKSKSKYFLLLVMLQVSVVFIPIQKSYAIYCLAGTKVCDCAKCEGCDENLCKDVVDRFTQPVPGCDGKGCCASAYARTAIVLNKTTLTYNYTCTKTGTATNGQFCQKGFTTTAAVNPQSYKCSKEYTGKAF